MEVLSEIPVRKTLHSKLNEVDFKNLEFGKYVADHMLICDFANTDWKAAQIVPYSNLSMNPTTLALHYGQTVFEGMKAFVMQDGRINIFRMDKHYDRFIKSLDRMCMPPIPKEIFVEGLKQLITVDAGWVPTEEGSALYIRPFMYASEAKFGVKISEEYRFIIFTGPVPSLFTNAIKLKVETNYIRAAKGGTGFAKCGGNYGGAFYPTQLAKKEGYDQLLWTGGKDNQFIEESGMMNAMFVINDILITAPTSDSILDGVTRDSLLTLANDLGFKIEERPISIVELETAFKNHTIQEAFGAGTAAVVAPVKMIHINGTDYQLPDYSANCMHNKLKVQLEKIRSGAIEDVHGWNCIV